MTRANQAGSRPKASDVKACGLLRRLLVMMYDTLVVIAIMMLATGLVLMLGLGNFTAGKDPLYTLYLIAVWFLYLAWCWRHGGMTLGMRAWSVRLVTGRGTRPSWAQCLSRFLVSLFSAAFIGLGFAWSLWDRERRTWHDLVSRSRLIRS